MPRNRYGEWHGGPDPLAPPYDVRGALDDPQAAANEYLQWVKYDNGATLPLINAPAQIDGRAAALRAAPGHAADTDEVLLEAGLTGDDLVRLKVAGAIS